GDLLPAHEAFAGVHGDGAHGRFAEMLGDFEHEAVALVLGLERVENRGEVPLELHVNDGADDLGDVSDWVGHGWSLLLHRHIGLAPVHTASAPEMISISSLVIIA